MISCTEFIPLYSELFKYIESKNGYDAVRRYWSYISDIYVKPRLGYLVEKHGIKGCWDYWAKALNEEAADFKMTLDEETNIFMIEMHYCPSKGRLNEYENVEPYHAYCEHCDILYRQVVEPLGFNYYIDLTHCDQARCTIKISSKKGESYEKAE